MSTVKIALFIRSLYWATVHTPIVKFPQKNIWFHVKFLGSISLVSANDAYNYIVWLKLYFVKSIQNKVLFKLFIRILYIYLPFTLSKCNSSGRTIH